MEIEKRLDVVNQNESPNDVMNNIIDIMKDVEKQTLTKTKSIKTKEASNELDELIRQRKETYTKMKKYSCEKQTS